VLLAASFAWPSAVRAAEYEQFIDVDTEEQLYDLLETNQISEETFDTLIDLYRRGVDLNSATREELYTLPNLSYDDVDAIIAYRDEATYIDDPAQLVAAGVVERTKLDSIAMFLVTSDPARPLAATTGFVRYQTAWTPEDRRVPPMALQARVTTLRHLTVGVAGTLSRNRIADVRYDPNREALSAVEAGPQLNLPKYFATWDADEWGIIVGTYRIGFAQRLTFDNSGRYTPNGFYLDDAVYRTTQLTRLCKESAGELADSPCTGDAGDVYVTPDYKWRDSLRGVAVGAKHIDLPVGWLSTYGFFSHETRDIYQYEIYDRSQCDDPQDDDSAACKAPDVFVRRDDPLEPTSRFSFQTLPNMYSEMLGGGNFSYFAQRRIHVGVTAYGARAKWLVDGADLDFQEWSSRPYDGPSKDAPNDYGAVGADAAWGRKWADIAVEVARSFDETPEGGGGMGAVLRNTATWGKHELELTGRYYDAKFANPYSRAISAPDEYDGLRARDEAGARLRYNGNISKRFSLRGYLDAWVEPSVGTPKLLTYLRGDVQATKWMRPGLWLGYQNKDLTTSDRDQCFSVSVEFDENGEQIPCGGEDIKLTPRVRFDPHRKFSFLLQYQHEWLDDTPYADHFRQDAAAYLILLAHPVDALRLRARARYLFEDIEDNTRLEQSMWTYLDVSYDILRHLLVRVRYDLVVWLDDRASTRDRVPSPEHWLRLELMGKF
jgi:hypothetical protein